MIMITNLIVLAVLAVIAFIVIKLILSISRTTIQILVHFVAGWFLLTVVNLLPGINIPVNLITLAISGFGGVIGTIILVIFYMI